MQNINIQDKHGTRYLSHCTTITVMLAKILQPLLVLTKRSLKLSQFAISDIIGHVTIGFVVLVSFPTCSQYEPTICLVRFLDIKLQTYTQFRVTSSVMSPLDS